jgi:hypothetical protein
MAVEYIIEFPGLVLHPDSVYFDRMILHLYPYT